MKRHTRHFTKRAAEGEAKKQNDMLAEKRKMARRGQASSGWSKLDYIVKPYDGKIYKYAVYER